MGLDATLPYACLIFLLAGLQFNSSVTPDQEATLRMVDSLNFHSVTW
jgi:hypothetical protein